MNIEKRNKVFRRYVSRYIYRQIPNNILVGVNPLSTNFTTWSNTLKQFVGKLPTNCLSVFDHFVGLTLKGLSLICYRIVCTCEKFQGDFILEKFVSSDFTIKTEFCQIDYQLNTTLTGKARGSENSNLGHSKSNFRNLTFAIDMTIRKNKIVLLQSESSL